MHIQLLQIADVQIQDAIGSYDTAVTNTAVIQLQV